ncbi:MAG TPA: DUF5684 domain-containing protein [Galbitalea sp.]|nr:DUF5684 domain-containing protein [Galbitalea sp.]
MSYDPGASIGLFVLIYGVVFGIFLFTLLINYVLYAIALSMFFRKVGVESWIAWVPYYRYWKWLEVEGQQGVYALFGIVPGLRIVTSIFLYIGMWSTGKAFGKDVGMLILGIFLPFVWLFILASKDEIYRPELIAAAGYPPPLAGYGSPAYAATHPPTSAS